MPQNMKISSDASTLVTDAYYYIPVTDPAAKKYFGSKCILINKDAGVGYFGILKPKDTFATHFAPMPKFRPKTLT